MTTLDERLQKLPLVIDNTQASTFRNCGHKYKWEYGVSSLTTHTVNVDLHAGMCFAKALETIYKRVWLDKWALNKALADAAIVFHTAWGDFVPQGLTKKTRLGTWECVLSYVDKYDPPHDYISPSSKLPMPFEFTFAVPITKEDFGVDAPMHPLYNEPFLYGGRFDMVGEQYGMLRLRDDKLTNRLGPTWEKRFTLRSQFIGYIAVMQALDFDVDTVEVRGIAPLAHEVAHQSCTKTYTKVQVARWKQQIARDIRQLVESVKSDEWSWNFDDQCSQYGGCKFLDLCRSDEPEDYFSTFATREWNPLHKED